MLWETVGHLPSDNQQSSYTTATEHGGTAVNYVLTGENLVVAHVQLGAQIRIGGLIAIASQNGMGEIISCKCERNAERV